MITSKFANGYALLIGVGETAYANWSLPVTVKDIQALHAVLANPNLCAYPNDTEHIRLLHDQEATHDNILKELNWLKEKAVADPEATVIVYYSGHGSLEKTENRYYLLQHDADPLDVPGSALSSEDFTNALRQIQAQRLLVIVDSCYAAGMATVKGKKADFKLPPGFVQTAAPKGFVDDLKEGKGRVVFASSRDEQKSLIRRDKEMSLYTYHLIEALKGATNQPGDTVVKVSNLMNHLGNKVPESARIMHREQVPRFNFDTEDFAIALLQGGKGLSAGNKEKSDKPSDTQKIIDRSDRRSGGVYFGSGAVTVSGDLVGRDQKKGDTVNVVRNISAGNVQQTSYSVMDIINELPGQRHFKTPEEVDRYIQEERDSWES